MNNDVDPLKKISVYGRSGEKKNERKDNDTVKKGSGKPRAMRLQRKEKRARKPLLKKTVKDPQTKRSAKLKTRYNKLLKRNETFKVFTKNVMSHKKSDLQRSVDKVNKTVADLKEQEEHLAKLKKGEDFAFGPYVQEEEKKKIQNETLTTEEKKLAQLKKEYSSINFSVHTKKLGELKELKHFENVLMRMFDSQEDILTHSYEIFENIQNLSYEGGKADKLVDALSATLGKILKAKNINDVLVHWDKFIDDNADYLKKLNLENKLEISKLDEKDTVKIPKLNPYVAPGQFLNTKERATRILIVVLISMFVPIVGWAFLFLCTTALLVEVIWKSPLIEEYVNYAKSSVESVNQSMQKTAKHIENFELETRRKSQSLPPF